jgi:hypothetical protein
MNTRTKLNFFDQYSSGFCFSLSLLLSVSIAAFNVSLDEGLIQTTLLMILTMFGGILVIWKLSKKLGDPHILKLAYVYMAKFPIVLLFIYTVWVPMLSPNAPVFGYDGQQYYQYGYQMMQSWISPGIDLDPIYLNHIGIVYYYAIVFLIFGCNSVAPAVLNMFLLLVAMMLVLVVGYKIKQQRSKYDWTLGLGILIPELILYDAMATRETVMIFAIVVSLFPVLSAMGAGRSNKPKATSMLPSIIGVAIIAMIRPPMLIAIPLCYLLFIFLKKRFTTQQVVVISLTVGILLMSPYIANLLGSSGLNIFKYKDLILNPMAMKDVAENLETGVVWNERSIGKLLLPSNELQAIVYAIPRSLMTFVDPLPKITFDVRELVNLNYMSWLLFITTLSPFIYVMLIPLALAVAVQYLADKRWPNGLLFIIPFIVLLMAAGGGNQIINARYRLSSLMFFVGTVWGLS